jgi:hypothetical protein
MSRIESDLWERIGLLDVLMMFPLNERVCFVDTDLLGELVNSMVRDGIRLV